ncbi:uncharacterized protein M6B38_404505 [Iris pallida]|uniref:Uncharacterized protein n=1 Tax=Iris pallida TaxID=29817 RepID=A0AAX6FN76_IRIPA|nr:uncharacterized protein M6B38_410270 [Iris pallida]KAJ6818960.1 uncharacterized protein M6B38_404505 [Iris pallida]
MAYKINCTNLPVLNKLQTNLSNSHRFQRSELKCRAQTRQETQLQASGVAYRVDFQTLRSCKLGIARYPDFEYNANGGTGTAIGRHTGLAAGAKDDDISVSFNVETLYIPALTCETTRFLGLPLPPFLKIEIVPEAFEGTINKTSGKVDLQFRAKFWFSVGRLYRAPPLLVDTTLTSEESIGNMREGKGERIDEEGRCRLVGVATVDPIDDVLMNSFLGLPTECIAIMDAKILITDTNSSPTLWCKNDSLSQSK